MHRGGGGPPSAPPLEPPRFPRFVSAPAPLLLLPWALKVDPPLEPHPEDTATATASPPNAQNGNAMGRRMAMGSLLVGKNCCRDRSLSPSLPRCKANAHLVKDVEDNVRPPRILDRKVPNLVRRSARPSRRAPSTAPRTRATFSPWAPVPLSGARCKRPTPSRR